MSRVVDTRGRPVAEGGVWITLRADSPGGVSLGVGREINPGETKLVPTHIGLRLIANQRAVRASAPVKAGTEGTPEVVTEQTAQAHSGVPATASDTSGAVAPPAATPTRKRK